MGEGTVRNDTGVYEGGEISMYYDPMIAKLCTWGRTAPPAIEAMRNALDSFEVEGIGHNLPFLSAVMDHPKFVSGDITTAFIAEEWPEGFQGVTLPTQNAAPDRGRLAAAMNRVAEIRRARISGTLDNHERNVGEDVERRASGRRFRHDHRGRSRRTRPSPSPTARRLRVEGDWVPGQSACADAI